ncbi:MAG: NAD(P)-dependent alcohol dehydrogenase [Deltaproteobacteria bacterium]|nr:NAD(P)-dependent alcohol dehydrogenase [Deltaproteobacteria bacterium]
MLKDVKAAIINEPNGQFVIQTVELDDLRSDEILVKIEACGVCHTDVIAQNMTPLPAVLGHEGCGVVEEVGSAVDRIKKGDRVIISIPYCGDCPSCAQGKTYICDKAMSLGFGGTRMDGSQTISISGKFISSAFFQQSSFATHAITLARSVVPIKGNHEPRMLAAIPCGIQTGAGAVLNTFKINPKDSLAVFGSGAVGLSAVMAGKIAGAFPLIAVDIVKPRLDLALELGATHTIDASKGEITKRILEIAPRGISFSLETSGNEQAFKSAVDCLAMGGTCGIVTAPHNGEPFPFSPLNLLDRASSIRGILLGASVPRVFLPYLIELNRQGRFPYERLITTYSFMEINQAFEDSKAGVAIKPVLIMN